MGFRRRFKRSNDKSETRRIARGMTPEQLEALPNMSDTLAMFAGQFLVVPPGDNRGKMLENILKIVTVAWNMPVAEQHNPAMGAEYRKTYDHLVRGMPEVAKSALDRLIERRTQHFSHDPRTAYAEVAQREGEYYIKATAQVVPATVPRNAPLPDKKRKR